MTVRRSLRRRDAVTPSQILAEGVVEIGRIQSIAYVLTLRKLRLFHVDAIRVLDPRGD